MGAGVVGAHGGRHHGGRRRDGTVGLRSTPGTVPAVVLAPSVPTGAIASASVPPPPSGAGEPHDAEPAHERAPTTATTPVADAPHEVALPADAPAPLDEVGSCRAPRPQILRARIHRNRCTAAGPVAWIGRARAPSRSPSPPRRRPSWPRAAAATTHDVAVVLGSGWSTRRRPSSATASTSRSPTCPASRRRRRPGTGRRCGRSRSPGAAVLVFLGRVHLYEGHDPAVVAHGVRTAAAAGCRTVVLTNAAGSLHREWPIGQPVADRRPHQPHRAAPR